MDWLKREGLSRILTSVARELYLLNYLIQLNWQGMDRLLQLIEPTFRQKVVLVFKYDLEASPNWLTVNAKIPLSNKVISVIPPIKYL